MKITILFIVEYDVTFNIQLQKWMDQQYEYAEMDHQSGFHVYEELLPFLDK